LLLLFTTVTIVPPLLLELPPKKPPEKKPPPKPKPPPDEPPITIGTPLEPLLATAIGGGGGGANIGGTMVRVVVTVWAGAAQATRRTVRRVSRCRTVRVCEARRTVPPVCACACRTMEGRAGGFSATCTAPPPMIAPPHVQAQSFAKAILTDISASLFLALEAAPGSGIRFVAGVAVVSRCKRSLYTQAR
jgi:hypothetical protein